MILTNFAHIGKFTMAIFHYKTVNNFIKCVIININYFRFLYCSNLWGNDVPTIDEAFGTYIHQKVDVNEETSCLAHITSLPHTSKKQQFMLLSTISNYHWYNLPSLKSSSSSKSAWCKVHIQVYCTLNIYSMILPVRLMKKVSSFSSISQCLHETD